MTRYLNFFKVNTFNACLEKCQYHITKASYDSLEGTKTLNCLKDVLGQCEFI